MDLVENDVDTLHEEIEYLVGHLVGNDVATLHEGRIHLMGFSFIRVIDYMMEGVFTTQPKIPLPLCLIFPSTTSYQERWRRR